MAFKLGDRIVKEIMYGYASDVVTGDPLYVLTQLSEGSVEITAESSDVTDKNGNLVKKIWKSKAGTFSATNAFINTNIIAAASGGDAEFAETDNTIEMPKIITVKSSSSTTTSVTLENAVSGSIHVNVFYGDGTLGDALSRDTAAGQGKFAEVTVAASGSTPASIKVTLPANTAEGSSQYIIKYTRQISNGAVVRNKAESFPNSVNLLLKVKYYDPCEKNMVKAAYLEMPSFQVSPETTLALNADDTTMDFSGDLELDYCSADRVLYNWYEVDEEDED